MTRRPLAGQDVSVSTRSLFEVASSSGLARVPARQGPLTIGRAPDNDIVLSGEPTVSRHHAELASEAAGEGDAEPTWSLRDLGSSNGTHVNGERLRADEWHTIAHGDVVAVGNATLRLVEDSDVDGQTVLGSVGQDLHQLLTALSKREREVLALVAAGRTDDQVAAELFISTKTVHSHLDRIRDKTGLRRRAELTMLAVRLGLQAPSAG